MSAEQTRLRLVATGRGTGRRPYRQMSRTGKKAGDAKSIDAHIDERTQGHLGRLIKQSYDELLKQPVPDRLISILDELARQERDK